ncbi:MAG: bifunctional [glutamate--ammonia ligase]-adenylyl-L-tyrosine phosphorylase/[glutamate--ammonia-ligase] adenylyltransferase [Burkholderiaceae bacterium]
MAFIAEQHSEYFRRSLYPMSQRDASLQQLNALISSSVDRKAIESAFEWHFDAEPTDIGIGLRRTRQLVFMALMERDLTGQADLNEICTAMSSMAQLVTNYAMRSAAKEMIADFGLPRDSNNQVIDLLAVGMGKAGANELNVSSDLDLVFLLRDEGQTDGITADGQPARRGQIASSDFAHRVARRTISLLSDPTADGFVFRIDTRLRPNGDSGPLVCTLPALEVYFQVQGREWERFAWLKAAVIADTGLSPPDQVAEDIKELNALIQPFVFRRYHDYDVFGALKKVHELIQTEANRRDMNRADGQDVKLGRGGIREIEFIAQLFQIVRGGRDRALRDRATLPTLSVLADRGLLDEDEVSGLRQAYQLLRRCEHMLQYRDDQQTHFLAADDKTQHHIAAMLGLAPDVFKAKLATSCAQVGQLFDSLLDPDHVAEADRPAAAGKPATDGLQPSGSLAAPDPVDEQDRDEISRQIEILRSGPRYRAARPEAQESIDVLLGAAQTRGVSLKCAQRLITLLETVCRRPAYLALLAQYPKAFERVLVILDASDWAASYLTRHPILLDELIDGHLYESTDLAQWQSDLMAEMNALQTTAGTDTERQMNVAREWHHAQLFRILAREIAGHMPIQTVADELSELADQTLKVALQTVWNQLAEKHTDQPRVAIIAYGRLGGKELGYASDLDLVFVYDDPHPDAAHAYAQLTRRVATWMSAQTPAGQLFDIDLRLRPNGEAGVLVSSLSGFSQYQRESAWVWEHQALTRARYCAGDPQVGEQFEELRSKLLAIRRDPAELRQEVLQMRKKMIDGHPNRTEMFDLKHDPGGMVDIEFIVQYLVLANACDSATMMDNIGNIALLRRAAELGLIAPDLAEQVAGAYQRFRTLQHLLRLQGAQYARVEPSTVETEIRAVKTLWDQLILSAGAA